jgi:predicted nucleic acid-binding protein
MAREVFVDTPGLYALADRRDPFHASAKKCATALVKSGTALVLTDYIIDEACTLAGAREALQLLEIAERSEAFRMLWVGVERFEAAKAFFRKHADHGYSFTHCTSFVLMHEMEIRKVLTTGRHFAEAGFRTMLKLS